MLAVLTVARFRHFQKAAEELGTSQPALSRTIRAIEEELGECVFDRRSHRVSLTPVGEHFVRFAEVLTDWRERGLGDIRQLIAAKRGRVTFACLPSIAASVACEEVRRFHEECPRVSVTVVEAPAASVIEMVQSGIADIGLGIMPGGESGMHVRPFCTDRLTGVGGAKHSLAKKQPLQWEHLRRANIIAMSKKSSVRLFIERVFAQKKMRFEPAFEVNLMSTAEAMAAANMGIAVLPSGFAGAIRNPAVFVKPLCRPSVFRRIMLFRRKNANLLPAALLMEDYLLSRNKNA